MTDINFVCPHCNETLEATPDMAGLKLDCPSCKQPVVVPRQRPQNETRSDKHPERSPVINRRITTITCQQCGGTMKTTKRTEKNLGLQLLGVLLFLVGLSLLLFFPLGTIAGIFIVIGSARLGRSKKNIWRCQNCGYFFERA